MLVNDVVLDDQFVAFIGPEVCLFTVKRTIAQPADDMVFEFDKEVL